MYVTSAIHTFTFLCHLDYSNFFQKTQYQQVKKKKNKGKIVLI